MVRGLSMLFCLLGANVVLGEELEVDEVGQVVDPHLVECNVTSDPNATVCPKFALSQVSTGLLGGLAMLSNNGDVDLDTQGNTTHVFGCCIEDAAMPSGGRCGSKGECEKLLTVHGTTLKRLVGIVAFSGALGLCLCCVTLYCCCCRSKKKGGNKKGGRQQMSDAESGSDSDNGCPIGRRNAIQFLEALENEYVRNSCGAVGDFFDGGGIPRADMQIMEQEERAIQESGDPERSIRNLRRKWGLE